QFVILRRAEVEIHIAAIIDVAVILLRADKGRLRCYKTGNFSCVLKQKDPDFLKRFSAIWFF
ncbi:hypothetical protein MJI95_23240, partial [Salmonella enterica subsp. enterica serovar Kentucky]|nr:hypothetical protein [Salmonella enterica subsp. enterica serovar Kentucky]